MNDFKLLAVMNFRQASLSHPRAKAILPYMASCAGLSDMSPDDKKSPYLYFVTDKIECKGKLYKPIWLLEDHQIYIGVINAYRR